jgi:hypothetical protein
LKGALTPTAGLTTVLVGLGDSGATRAGSSSSAMSSAHLTLMLAPLSSDLVRVSKKRFRN